METIVAKTAVWTVEYLRHAAEKQEDVQTAVSRDGMALPAKQVGAWNLFQHTLLSLSISLLF